MLLDQTGIFFNKKSLDIAPLSQQLYLFNSKKGFKSLKWELEISKWES